jgi:hypothetical protein
MGAGTGAGEVNAAAGSKNGLRDWTKRRKEEEEKAPVAAASAGEAAMRDVRPYGSERAADGRGAGGAEETGFAFGLDLGLGFDFDFAAAVGLGLGRGLGGGGDGGGAEWPRGGETETSERRDPSESESSACVGEYIGGGGARSRVWWGGMMPEAARDWGEICWDFPAKALVRRSCGGSGCRKELWKYHESPGPIHRAARHVLKIEK